MQKTRLGITVGMLGAAVYFTGIFSGYLVAVLLAGYVLLFEENVWLKRSAVKAIALMIYFSLLISVLNLIPNFISAVDSIVNIFRGNFQIMIINNIVKALVDILGFVEKVLFLMLGYKALSQGTIAFPAIDNLISKYME